MVGRKSSSLAEQVFFSFCCCLPMTRVTSIVGLLPRLTPFWIIFSQNSSNFLLHSSFPPSLAGRLEQLKSPCLWPRLETKAGKSCPNGSLGDMAPVWPQSLHVLGEPFGQRPAYRCVQNPLYHYCYTFLSSTHYRTQSCPQPVSSLCLYSTKVVPKYQHCFHIYYSCQGRRSDFIFSGF